LGITLPGPDIRPVARASPLAIMPSSILDHRRDRIGDYPHKLLASRDVQVFGLGPLVRVTQVLERERDRLASSTAGVLAARTTPHNVECGNHESPGFSLVIPYVVDTDSGHSGHCSLLHHLTQLFQGVTELFRDPRHHRTPDV